MTDGRAHASMEPRASALDVPFVLGRALRVACAALRSRSQMPTVLKLGRASSPRALRSASMVPAELVWSTAPFSLVAIMSDWSGEALPVAAANPLVELPASAAVTHVSTRETHFVERVTSRVSSDAVQAPATLVVAASSVEPAPALVERTPRFEPHAYHAERLCESASSVPSPPLRHAADDFPSQPSATSARARPVAQSAPREPQAASLTNLVSQRPRPPIAAVQELTWSRSMRAVARPSSRTEPLAGTSLASHVNTPRVRSGQTVIEPGEGPPRAGVPAHAKLPPALAALAAFRESHAPRASARAEANAMDEEPAPLPASLPTPVSSPALFADALVPLEPLARGRGAASVSSVAFEEVVTSLRTLVETRIADQTARIESRLRSKPAVVQADEPDVVPDAYVRKIMKRMQVLAREERFRDGKLR